MKKVNLFLIIILAFHLLLLFRLKFTAWPEMLLWPYLMLHGLLPYKDIAIVHTPNLIVDLAVFYKLFGVGFDQLKYFTWALILISDLTVFLVVKKLWSEKIAVLSTFSFVILSLLFDVNGLWFDLLLTPLSLILFFLIKKKKFFVAGAIWALMFFTKQTAFWFLIPVAVEFLRDQKTKKQFVQFPFGISLAFVLFLTLISFAGIITDFYKWAIYFGIFILPRSQGQIQAPNLKSLIYCLYPFLLFIPNFLDKKKENLSILVWAVAGALGAYPRFEYFHFLPATTFLAITTGLSFSTLPRNILQKIFKTFFVLGVVYLFLGYFLRNYDEGVRFYESDVREVASYISENTKPGDAIFVVNWWDNIYALTNTIPATRPWVPQLEWYQELDGIQNGEVESIKSTMPKIIILKPYETSGLAAYVPSTLYSFITSNYHLKEKISGVEIFIPNK